MNLERSNFFSLSGGKKKLFYISIATFALAFIAYLSFTALFCKSTKDYLKADNLFSENQKKEQVEIFRNLTKRYPDLGAKFEAGFAKLLVADKQGKQAEEISKTVFDRIAFTNGLHKVFAKTSLLIAEERYSEALEQAQALKKEMESNKNERCLLFALNLLRIASLEKQLGAWMNERATLNQLELVVTDNREVKKQIAEMFNDQGVSLNDYIVYRKKIINQSEKTREPG